MRFPNALFQQLAAAKKGVIMEPTDAQLVVPAVGQLQLEISSPIVTASVPSTAVQELSFGDTLVLNRAGVQVAVNTQSAGQLAAGIWRIRGTCVHFFTGTTNGLNSAQFGLSLPGAAGTVVAFATFNFLNVNQVLVATFDWVVHLLTPWNIGIAASATVALDVNNESFSFFASRIL